MLANCNCISAKHIPVQLPTDVGAGRQKCLILKYILSKLVADLNLAVRNYPVYVAKVVVHLAHLAGLEVDL
jgi:hypothetical protein